MKKFEWFLLVFCAAAFGANALWPAAQAEPLREAAAPLPVTALRSVPALWLGDPPVDVNAADAEALEALPGLGPVLAERIVAYRQENGPFLTVEALLEVKGVGEQTLLGLLDDGA